MPCDVCHDSYWVSETVDGVERVRRCDCWRAAIVEHQLAHARIPRRYMHCELANFEQTVDSLREAHRRARAFVEAFPAVDKGLLLRGRHGVGKTHLAVAMLKEIVRSKGARGYFYETRELLKLVRDTYATSGDESEMDVLRPVLEADILVLDDLGRECPPGTVGELVHRGPTVALGYHEDPEATARAFRPDPFAGGADAPRVVYSGDLVRRDDEGFLYFVGRRDQLIKSLGHRMSPDEIEVIVLASGLVSEVVAKGVSDAVAGQVVELHVVPRDGAAFSLAALVAWCRREMPGYMLPKAVHVHESFPRTASGKIDRKQVGLAA
jgi:acyl-CoA synthetase (AMP-forming)/AMP-acid ligase II